MAFAKPEYSRNQVNRAGDILILKTASKEETEWAYEVLANWRACHGYPINTFQATLRQKLKSIDKKAIVAQRLKRAPSVIQKLERFSGMQLARMQDIGGLRAIVNNINKVRKLEDNYLKSMFKHEFDSSKDYIKNPKEDGYRCVHLIYKYSNPQAPEYDGLRLELQFRSKLQHAWATAVETMGTYLGQALKSGQGEREWREFFRICSAAFCIEEKSPSVPGFEKFSQYEISRMVADKEKELSVLNKLQGFAIATDAITEHKGPGAYHLVVLHSEDRTVSVIPYPKAQLEKANEVYADYEKRTQNGEKIEAVLVSAGPVSELKKAYPNYFLDTQEFVKRIRKIINAAQIVKY